MKIDQSSVAALGELARIELRPDEQVAFATQLPAIVDYVGALEQVMVDAPPVGRMQPPAPRADEVRPSDHREAILGQAPERVQDFWRVPPVM